jgi:inosine-uridine nucleoside N-ribohydrolase
VAFAASLPVIYCTDLFHPPDDPDDHFDLATLFALPELDIRAIILDLGQQQRKESGETPVRQLMAIFDRKPKVVVPGLANPLRYPGDKALDQFQPGTPDVILRVLRESSLPVTIITTGSLRDVAAAFNRDEALFRSKVARLYVNDGNAAGGTLHWNPRLDPQAYLRLMRSDLPIFWPPASRAVNRCRIWQPAKLEHVSIRRFGASANRSYSMFFRARF